MRAACVSRAGCSGCTWPAQPCSHYHVHDRRGHVGMRAGGILSRPLGLLPPVSRLPARILQRPSSGELRFIHEQYDQAWAEEMARLLHTIKAAVASTAEAYTALPPERLTDYAAAYDALIAQGLAANPPPAQTHPRPRGRPKQSLQKTCSTACSNINLASWPLCMTSASPLTTTRPSAMCA